MEIQCNSTFQAHVIWGELAAQLQSELTLQKSEIWRLSGFLEEYGGAAEGDHDRGIEHEALISKLTGVLTQAVAREAADRQAANSSGRSAGRPRDVITPYLAPGLLLAFLRCHDWAGRQSAVTCIDGELKQKEAGQLFEFIEIVIGPLNRYLMAELHRKTPLSAARLARLALDKWREDRQIQTNPGKPRRRFS